MMSDKDEERAMEREAGRKEVFIGTPFHHTPPWMPPGPLTFNQPDDLEMTDLGRSYGTYSAFRAQGWTDEQMVEHGHAVRVDKLPQPWAPMPLPEVKQRHWTTRAVELAKLARMDGVVITIEQQPCEPLAMGNHRDVVTVREVRSK